MKERDKIRYGLNEVKFKLFEIIKVLPSEIIIILLHWNRPHEEQVENSKQ